MGICEYLKRVLSSDYEITKVGDLIVLSKKAGGAIIEDDYDELDTILDIYFKLWGLRFVADRYRDSYHTMIYRKES